MVEGHYQAGRLDWLDDSLRIIWDDELEWVRPELNDMTVGELKDWLIAHGEDTPYYDIYEECRKLDFGLVTDETVVLDFH